jgi:hypothetical protein
MAIDFPNSPALNDYFESNGKAWTFNGTSWDIVQTPANLSIANASITGAKLASGAAVTNIGYTPANTASPTFTGTVVLPSDTSIGTITSTELGYVDGVTSAIQTQLNAKAPLSAPTFTGTVTVSNDLTVSGDFTVSGTTTTINTETVTVNDNIIVLNNNASGSPTENAGIEIERGSSTNVQIRWNETTDKWQFTNDGTNYTDFGAGGATISDTAPVSPEVGSLWFESDTAQTFVYYDSSWIEIGATAMGATVSTTAPNSPIGGQIWFNSDTGGTYVYYGSAWVEVGAAPVNLLLQAIDAKGDLLVGTADNTVDNLAVGANGSVLMADSSTATGLSWSSQSLSNRNAVINGAMQVHQRGTSTASITADGYYTADRWLGAVSGLGTWTQSVESDAPTGSGFRKSLKMLCTTANASPTGTNNLAVVTYIEGQNLQQFAKGTASAKQFALSFWVKSNVTGTYVAELFDVDNTRQTALQYTISSSATWEKKTLIFTADATGAFDNDNAKSLQVTFWMGAGSGLTSGTLQTTWASNTTANRAVGQVNLAAATSNYYQITGVQLEAGAVATPFEFEDYSTTLAKCQRYFWKVSGAISPNIGLCVGVGTGGTSPGIRRLTLALPVSMRTKPTITIGGTHRLYTGGLANRGLASVNFNSSGLDRISIDVNTENTTTAGESLFWVIDSSNAIDYLDVSAEL